MSLYITNCHKLSQPVTTTCHYYVSLLRVTMCHYMSLYVTIRHYMSYIYILLHTNHALAVLLVASGCICWGCFSHLCKSWHIARCSTLSRAHFFRRRHLADLTTCQVCQTSQRPRYFVTFAWRVPQSRPHEIRPNSNTILRKSALSEQNIWSKNVKIVLCNK